MLRRPKEFKRETQQEDDLKVIGEWTRRKEAQTAREKEHPPAPILPNATFQTEGLDELTAELVIKALKYRECIPVAYKRTQGMKIDSERVRRVTFTPLNSGGQYRITGTLHTFVEDAGKETEIIPPLRLKIQKATPQNKKPEEYALHQVTAVRFNPAPGDVGMVGGTWMLDDGRILLFLRHREGKTYNETVNSLHITPEEKNDVDYAMAKRMVEWWKAEDGHMIADPHGLNFLVLDEKGPDGKPQVDIIDTGKVVKTDEQQLIMKIIIDPNITPELPGAEYSDYVAEPTWRTMIRTKTVADAVKDVLGPDGAAEFFRKAYAGGPKYGSTITPRFDKEIKELMPEAFT